MDKLTNDILPEGSDFFIEKFTYPTKVTMHNSHYHNHYEILYMLRGERELIINNINHYILSENTIAIIPPNCIHRTKSHSDEQQMRICIAVSKNMVEQIKKFTSENILYCASFYNIEMPWDVKKLVRDMLSRLMINTETPFCKDYQKAIMLQLFLTLSNYTYNNTEYKSVSLLSNDSVKKSLDEIVTYIQEHAFEDISLDSVANTFHIQKTYLSRCFKKHTGSTVVTYINNIRIIKAQQLICEANIPIETVAYTVGYNNRMYFNKVFKKLIGTSPKQYQMIARNAQNNN